MPRLRRHAHGLFRQAQAFFGDFLRQNSVFRRVNDINAARQNGHGATVKRGQVCCGIDAARQSRDHDTTGLGQVDISDCPQQRRGVG